MLKLPDLGKRALSWLEQQTPMYNYWVIGGGSPVDLIRKRFSDGKLTQSESHWESIRVMEQNTLSLKAPFSAWPLVNAVGNRSPGATRASNDEINFRLLPLNWLKTNTSLPQNWSVSSDSIAACLAAETSASELAILKSADPESTDLSELSNSGYVDAYFPEVASELSSELRFVNLRHDRFRHLVDG